MEPVRDLVVMTALVDKQKPFALCLGNQNLSFIKGVGNKGDSLPFCIYVFVLILAHSLVKELLSG